ncbi:hypothetical protein COBT_002356 [Conglomerata obtusa]
MFLCILFLFYRLFGTTTLSLDAANSELKIITSFDSRNENHCTRILLVIFFEGYNRNTSVDYKHSQTILKIAESKKYTFYYNLTFLKKILGIDKFALEINEDEIFDKQYRNLSFYKSQFRLNNFIPDLTLNKIISMCIMYEDLTKNNIANKNLPLAQSIANFFDLIAYLYISEYENKRRDFVSTLLRSYLINKYIYLHNIEAATDYIVSIEIIHFGQCAERLRQLNEQKQSPRSLWLLVWFDEYFLDESKFVANCIPNSDGQHNIQASNIDSILYKNIQNISTYFCTNIIKVETDEMINKSIFAMTAIHF